MTTTITKKDTIKRTWHLIDVKDKTLGRISTNIASLLMGKHKPYYSPNLDCGDYVVVTNVTDIKVTGNKRTQKLYRHHTGYPGGFRERTFNEVQAKNPKEIITQSVKGMLPKNKLRSPRLKRLKIFLDSNHSYQDQLKAS